MLSFPLDVSEGVDSHILAKQMKICLGSVVINYELAEQVAKKQGHSTQDEISLLFIHGFLHILGYDHEVDNGEQRALEQKIIESLGLKESLIVRNT